MENSIFEKVKATVPLRDYLASRQREPNREGKIHCPWHEEKTPSCHVFPNHVHCFGCGKTGDVVDVAIALEGFPLPHSAAMELARRYSIAAHDSGIMRGRELRKARRMHQAMPGKQLAKMPMEAMVAWSEGVDYLRSNSALIERLAEFRGWPVPFARYLAEYACLSMPLYRDQRTVAFLVSAPEPLTNPLGGRIVMHDIGFHCRIKPREGEAKASWRYVPNESEHGQRTAALPFIIGGSWFDSARLLIITEGQWDALTFALAAGWLGDGDQWPDGVCVIGIRGATGDKTFLQYYERFWSPNASCLLLPDSDSAGGKWAEGKNSFADRLGQLCQKVAVIKCQCHKDLNDLYRATEITPQQIERLLASHGLLRESEVAK
jgi:hypothetical protein